MKKFISVILAVLLCVSLISACKKQENEKDETSEYNKVIGVVGDMEITQGYYNLVYNISYFSAYENVYSQASMLMTGEEKSWIDIKLDEEKTVGDYISESAYSEIEQLATVVTIAKDYGIVADESVKKSVEEQKKIVIENYGGKEGFEEFLKESRSNYESVDTYLQVREIYSRFFEKVTKEDGEAYIEEETIKKSFDQEMAGKLKVQHILVSTQGETDEMGNVVGGRTDEEALAIVNEILERLAAGEEFDALISEYDEDPGMEPGKFYIFGDNEMVKEFETASKNLKSGEYTKNGVKTSYGYHIIKRYALDEESDEYKSFREQLLGAKVMEIVDSKDDSVKKEWKKDEINSYIKKWNESRIEQ